ncbi:MAG: response regulator [Bdellovibrionales bacterium]
MQIHTINAEKKLASVASSIGRSPSSWQDWHALEIGMTCENADDNLQSALLWVDSVLSSYLKDVEGSAYFCHGSNVHVLCKQISRKTLQEAGAQIETLMREEEGLGVHYAVHNLCEDGFAYVQSIFQSQSIRPVMSAQGHEREVKHTTIEHFDVVDDDIATLEHFHDAKVLLVEDDPVTRWMVRNSLKHECEFATAPSANQAFSKFQAFQPDIVFLDIDLPDKSGREVLEWIIRNDPGVCVVMFSSNDNLDTISETLEEGASGFIAKPFLKEDLLGYIRAHNQMSETI